MLVNIYTVFKHLNEPVSSMSDIFRPNYQIKMCSQPQIGYTEWVHPIFLNFVSSLVCTLESHVSIQIFPSCRTKMRSAIKDAGGVEAFAIGDVNESGIVTDLTIHCRGNEGAVPALLSRYNPGQVVIHNHPSGILKASEADMILANRYGDDGVGVAIVNNNVDADFWVVEPHKPTAESLDPTEVQHFSLNIPYPKLCRI